MEIGINYGGHTSQPADDISRDGDLDYVVNLYNENDSLNAVQNPFLVSGITPGWRIVYVHSAATYRHLILINESDTTSSMPIGAIAWIDFPSGSEYETNLELESTEQPIGSLAIQGAQINKVVGIGNTIVILTPAATHYILWKSDAVGYIYLGDHIPEVDLQFELQRSYESFTISGHDGDRETWLYVGEVTQNLSAGADEEGEIRDANINAVLGGVNAVQAECKERGLFINNFFVRYALQLYDGNITHHSAPVLMIAASDRFNPLVTLASTGDVSGANVIRKFYVTTPMFNLAYKLLSDKSSLDDWADIVKAVDVYVTPEITNYNASGKFKRQYDISTFNFTSQNVSGRPGSDDYNEYKPDDMYFVARSQIVANESTQSSRFTFYRDVADLWNAKCISTSVDDEDVRYMQIIDIPKFSEEYLETKYNSARFYFLKSIPIRELSASFSKINTADGVLTALEQPDRLMANDNRSHDKTTAKNAFVYNNRLNIVNISHCPFRGFKPKTATPFCDYNADIIAPYTYITYVYLRENGQDVIVKQSGELKYLSPYFFYPNPNAYKVVIGIIKAPSNGGQITTNYYELPLKVHDSLNGAYYLGLLRKEYKELASPTKFFPDYLTPLANFVEPTEEEIAEKWIEYPNKIYTSEVNNPFLFKAEGVNSISTAEILALSSVTKALSQGQFGQFPMYAFTTDGVWALETSTTGGIASLHPVTRDVCTNIDSITQIDNAVLFHTARGIMLLQGSETICISDSIDSPTLFNVSKLPQFLKIPNEFMLLNLPRTPFKKFLENSGMLYDYTNQRIVLYQKSDKLPSIPEVSYVYSLKSKTWSLMQTNIKYAINAYPNALVVGGGERGDNMLSDHSYIFNYSHSNPNTPVLAHQMLITRPLKLDAPFNLKTINTLIQRGNFAKGKVRTILYGSRDLINWHLVASSVDHTLRNFRGTPYKYFRIVALTDLSAGESLTGASILFDVRQNNQLR